MKKVLLGVVIALVLVFGGCLAFVGGVANEVDKELSEDAKTAADGGVTSMTDDSAVDHVTIKSCKVGQFGDITASLVIKNKGDDQASYTVTAEALKGNRRIAELNAFANNIRPGQTANTKAVGMVEGNAKTVECKLVAVERF